MKIQKLLNELNLLALPKDSYAIFWSGPLGVRNIRESEDLDIVVKSKLWEELKSKYSSNLDPQKNIIKIWNIEILNQWDCFENKIDELIDTADMISWFPFVKLEYLLIFKQHRNSEKDQIDILLINNYLDE